MKKDHNRIFETPALTVKQTEQQTIDNATADAQCREKTNYEKTLKDINNAYLTTFLADKQNLIQQVTEAKKTAENNAPKILNK